MALVDYNHHTELTTRDHTAPGNPVEATDTFQVPNTLPDYHINSHIQHNCFDADFTSFNDSCFDHIDYFDGAVPDFGTFTADNCSTQSLDNLRGHRLLYGSDVDDDVHDGTADYLDSDVAVGSHRLDGGCVGTATDNDSHHN